MQRIQNAYCEGSHKRKPGHSQLLRDESELPKSDSSCQVQSLAWKVGVYAGHLLLQMPVEDARARHFMKWLQTHTISFGAYCFNKGNTNHQVFPDDAVASLKSEILRMKKDINRYTGRAATDFVRQKTEYGLLIEMMQVHVRELEAEFVRWMYDYRVVSDFYSHLIKDRESGLIRFDRMINLSSFLNRLSTYLFWLNQYHGMLINQTHGIPYEFVEWDSMAKIGSLFP